MLFRGGCTINNIYTKSFSSSVFSQRDWASSNLAYQESSHKNICMIWSKLGNRCTCQSLPIGIINAIYASGTSWWPRQNCRNFATTENYILELKLDTNQRQQNGNPKVWRTDLPDQGRCYLKMPVHLKNIDRGTTDPGYWVQNLNYL